MHISLEKFKERMVSEFKDDDTGKIEEILKSDMCPEIKETMDCDKARSFHKCLFKAYE